MHGSRLEGTEVLKVGKERQCYLFAHISYLEFCHDQPQVLHGPYAPDAAVTDKSRRLIVPFLVQEIDGILERTGGAVIVFGGHKYIPIKRGNLLRPDFGMLLRVLSC